MRCSDLQALHGEWTHHSGCPCRPWAPRVMCLSDVVAQPLRVRTLSLQPLVQFTASEQVDSFEGAQTVWKTSHEHQGTHRLLCRAASWCCHHSGCWLRLSTLGHFSHLPCLPASFEFFNPSVSDFLASVLAPPGASLSL